MSLRDTLLDALPLCLALRSARRLFLLGVRSLARPTILSHHGIRLRIGEHLSPTIRRALYGGQYEGGS